MAFCGTPSVYASKLHSAADLDAGGEETKCGPYDAAPRGSQIVQGKFLFGQSDVA
jgi:hypothetical protein